MYLRLVRRIFKGCVTPNGDAAKFLNYLFLYFIALTTFLQRPTTCAHRFLTDLKTLARRAGCCCITHTARTWRTHGTHMAHTRHAHGAHTARTWRTHGAHTARTWRTHGTHAACQQRALFVSLFCYIYFVQLI